MRLRTPEIVIAALVVAVVAMLIVPLPRPLLDLLLVANIASAVALLMAAVFSPRPLQFVSFPTLLVVATLFRVGLEVSATRLILAEADAGDVVAAFGSSVVAGNLVVGLVVFAVITVVQLVVVSRGAERVAEVAARFALDALPGKQMAIDADLRAGTIDAETARQRRADLERESQLYGAMDGAMRFVKGDAIAAIVIVLINLVGGLVIGVGSRGLSAGEAMRTYSLLSIGEGLVSQIPSLIVAIASGLLVTRVASTGDRPIGDDLGSQLAGQPRVLVAVAILLAALGLVPGMPLVPFLVLGVLAAGGAIALHAARPGTRADLAEPGANLARGSRVVLRIGKDLHLALARDPGALHAALAAVREELATTTGVVLGPLGLEAADTTDIAIVVDGTPSAYLSAASLAELRAALPGALTPLAPDLLGVDRVAALVDKTAARSPVLVKEVVPRVITLPALTEVLRGLVREGVPITDLAAILEAIAATPGDLVKQPAALVEHLRGHLRRQISARFAPKGQLAVFTVDPMIEDAVRSAVDRRDGTSILALEPAIAQDIVTAVRARTGAEPAVILASSDIRRHLRTLLEPELPTVTILAAHELTPGTTISTSAIISV